MPLWSVAEWRVRIGSSWCALGRPFKTKSSFKRGLRQTGRALTKNQGTSMLILLIMLIGINLVLHTVIQERHHHSFLSREQVVSTAVNITSCWKIESLMTSQSLKIVQQLDTTLFTSASESVIHSLLLISGDVEQNPGPGRYPNLDYDSIDANQMLNEDDDLFDVLDQCLSLKSQYYELGAALKVHRQELDSIHSSLGENPQKALSSVLLAWLQQKYNVQRFGQPTWRMLVEAVDSPAGGNNHALAQKIASNHPVAHLTIENIREILDITWDYRAKWKFIGVELGIDVGSLDAIEENNKKVEGCLFNLISQWLRDGKSRPTRSALIKVLQSKYLAGEATSNKAQNSKSGVTAHHIDLKEYADYLKTLYRAKTQASFSDDQWPPPVTNKVFNLALIKTEQVRRKKVEESFVRQKTITGKVDDVLQEKIPIELQDVFKKNEGHQKKVLMEGAPGCGKSTLSLHICQWWADGQLFQEYNVVILVRLRDSAIMNAECIADLLPRRDETMGQDLIKAMIASDGRGILFVLDGWDELPQEVSGHLIILKLLKSIKLHECSIIITSRPTTSANLHPLVSSRIEIMGFSKVELQRYFTGCLQDNTKAVEILLQRIQENPSVEGSCYLPLNASILVHLFKCEGNSLPITQYGIFSALIINCILRHSKKSAKQEIYAIKSLDELPPTIDSHFRRLCDIAYRGIMEDKVIFDLGFGFNTLGLLQGVESFVMFGRSHSYNFLHLSIQELLAAHHMSIQLNATEQIKQFRQLFGQARFSAVFQFFAAKTKLQTPGIGDVVIQIAKSSDKTLKLSLLHCLFEAQDPSLCSLVANNLNSKLHLSGISLTPADCLSLRHFLKYASDVQECSLKSNSISDKEIVAISVGMKNMINLRGLYLTNNKIGDDGAVAISLAMESLHNLEYLHLNRNNIKGKGAKAISASLKSTPHLKELDLENNSIGNEGAIALSYAMDTMTKLKLFVSNNYIRETGRVALSQSAEKPGITIYGFEITEQL